MGWRGVFWLGSEIIKFYVFLIFVVDVLTVFLFYEIVFFFVNFLVVLNFGILGVFVITGTFIFVEIKVLWNFT